MKVRFLRDQVVIDGLEGTSGETWFRSGQVVDLTERSADRWIRRDIAEPVHEDGEQDAGTSTPTGEIEHVGGGWYVLPDGSRVKGKAAALAAAGG